MSKPKKHILTFEQIYDFELIGICTHHSDYRLAWGLNETLNIQLEKAEADFVLQGKKGNEETQHSTYHYKDHENIIEYYLVKNKSAGKFLIPEKPTIDYFLFIYENHVFDIQDIVDQLRSISSVIGAYCFDPEELSSTEHIIFN
jgi:hypothetical protein